MPITLDSSAAAAWLLPDESSVAADRLYAQGLRDPGLFQAPALWAWETGNLLQSACRRGRMDDAQLDEALRLLQRAPVRLEPAPDASRVRDTLSHARRFGLSFYHASYLEQALRTGAQLATKDTSLQRAAAAAGVLCIAL